MKYPTFSMSSSSGSVGTKQLIDNMPSQFHSRRPQHGSELVVRSAYAPITNGVYTLTSHHHPDLLCAKLTIAQLI